MSPILSADGKQLIGRSRQMRSVGIWIQGNNRHYQVLQYNCTVVLWSILKSKYSSTVLYKTGGIFIHGPQTMHANCKTVLADSTPSIRTTVTVYTKYWSAIVLEYCGTRTKLQYQFYRCNNRMSLPVRSTRYMYWSIVEALFQQCETGACGGVYYR
jgi:hypothetical protein